MTFYECVTRVANRCNKNVSDTTTLARIKNHVNDSLQEGWESFDWTFRHREYLIKTLADVTTGTATATNASQAVTLSSAVANTTLHKGAWIRFTADAQPTNWYRVVEVPTTSTLTIEPAYQGTTGASKAYELKKLDYLLPSELMEIESLTATCNGTPIQVAFMRSLSQIMTPPLYKGQPTEAAIFDVDVTGASYSTGTVSGTASTNTLTGSGTAWLTNVVEGDSILVGTNSYTVYKVNSDTSITLYNLLASTVAASTYTVTRRFGRILRLTPSADLAYSINLLGLRAFAPLVNNSDSNSLLVHAPAAVVEAAVWRELASSPDSRSDATYQKSVAMWEEARSKDRGLTPRASFRPVFSDRRRGR
jgi:hypothetical protein